MPKDIQISRVKAVIPDPEGIAVTVRAEALIGESITELEISITTDLAPAVAIALLATTARARAERDGLEPALEVLAAAVVASGSAEKVRLQLLFDRGGVLPVEMPSDAGEALKNALIRSSGA